MPCFHSDFQLSAEMIRHDSKAEPAFTAIISIQCKKCGLYFRDTDGDGRIEIDLLSPMALGLAKAGDDE